MAEADIIRSFCNINLNELRSAKTMTSGREYLIDRLSEKGIFISLGTNMPGIMPHKTKEKTIGAFWVPNEYEKNAPWVFVDTKDDINKEESPIGRQIYGIVLMLVYIAYNHTNFYFNGKEFEKSTEEEKYRHDVTSEILLPKEEMLRFKEEDIDVKSIPQKSRELKATPTFLIKRLHDIRLIGREQYTEMKNQVAHMSTETTFARNKGLSYPKAQVGYITKRYAREIINESSKLSRNVLSNALFNKVYYSSDELDKRINGMKNVLHRGYK